MNMVRVLERLGLEVEYDDRQTCCGQPAFNTGYHRDAVQLAERFIDIFTEAEHVVAPSGSCVTMSAVFYQSMLPLSDAYRERAEALRPRTHEFTSFLVDTLGIEDVGATFRSRVTMHDSCHALRELGIAAQPRRLLRKVAGLELVEMDQAQVCCGFGGTFAVKHADVSTAMGIDKVASIRRANIDVVTGVDSSCLMHIDGILRRGSSRIRAMHIADILAAEE